MKVCRLCNQICCISPCQNCFPELIEEIYGWENIDNNNDVTIIYKKYFIDDYYVTCIINGIDGTGKISSKDLKETINKIDKK